MGHEVLISRFQIEDFRLQILASVQFFNLQSEIFNLKSAF